MSVPTGRIKIQLQANTQAGLGPLSKAIYYTVPRGAGRLSDATVATIVVCVLILVVGLVISSFIIYTRCIVQDKDGNAYTTWNPYYGGLESTPYEPDEWEVPVADVHFDHHIGQGSFGSVYLGTARLPPPALSNTGDKQDTMCQVAVKTLPENATVYDRQAFLNEASIMKQFNCYHVVKLMGIVSVVNTSEPPEEPAAASNPRPPYVIMELMERGDLKSYLRALRPDDNAAGSLPSDLTLLPGVYRMAVQVADGMAYLSSVNSVHRDLAARNCMLTGDDDNITVKIGDFGMTRHLYEKDYYKKGGKGLLPVRWMGPESLRDGVFTSHSDVWSFGVVLWEMATYSAQPYQGLSNEEVITRVLERGHMDRPAGCSDQLYQLMLDCWQYRAVDRPTFVELVERLLQHADDVFVAHSYYHTVYLVSAERDAPAKPGYLRGDGGTPPAAGRPFVLRPLMAHSEDLSSADEQDGDVTLDADGPSVKFTPSGGGGDGGSNGSARASRLLSEDGDIGVPV